MLKLRHLLLYPPPHARAQHRLTYLKFSKRDLLSARCYRQRLVRLDFIELSTRV